MWSITVCDHVTVCQCECCYALMLSHAYFDCIATCFSVFLCLLSLMLINNYIRVHFG